MKAGPNSGPASDSGRTAPEQDGTEAGEGPLQAKARHQSRQVRRCPKPHSLFSWMREYLTCQEWPNAGPKLVWLTVQSRLDFASHVTHVELRTWSL
jgi:hypothetical protein